MRMLLGQSERAHESMHSCSSSENAMRGWSCDRRFSFSRSCTTFTCCAAAQETVCRQSCRHNHETTPPMYEYQQTFATCCSGASGQMHV